MRLLRVQVPEFRALKDVDISFEPEFTPQVFPLGSLNGGGKSTLLQLIFVLLHCFSNKEKNPNNANYYENITELIHNYNDTKSSTLAVITLLTSKGKLTLDYLYGTNINTSLDKNIEHLVFYFDDYFLTKVSYIDIPESKNESWTDSETKEFNKIFRELEKEIQGKVFLISPSNQPYIFLKREHKRLLFAKNTGINYDSVSKILKSSLNSFYTYDFEDVVTEIFRTARRKNFKERNKDNPFAHTEKLESDINNLFINGKKIVPFIIEEERHTKDEIQGVYFKLPNGTEIYPEDLSHGELKRLAIFVLIKYHEMNDSVVLMDEIENGFHPDWQYQIVRDLIEWGENNQYILATHSYELCTAVTPAHVKELEPRLSK